VVEKLPDKAKCLGGSWALAATRPKLAKDLYPRSIKQKQSRKTNAQQHALDDHASWLIAQRNLRKL
jgi:hypothetical protein